MADTLVKKTAKSKVKSTVCYVVGSVAVCAGALIVIPKVAPYISGTINKKKAKISNAKKAEDDWSPVIEKKHPDKNEEEE